MEAVVKLVKAADKLLSALVALMLVIALLYGGYALYDTYQVYNNAGVDQQLLRYKPMSGKNGSNPGLSELADLNPDVCAWLTIDNTNIDYPVLQAGDNVKYVNTDVYGKYSLSGSVFLDSECDREFAGFYSLMYGHHMEGGMMFGDLEHFPEPTYFQEHETGTLFLQNRTFTIRIFACLCVDAYDSYVFRPLVTTEEEKTGLLNYLRTSAVQYRDVGISAGDQILGLSTCSSAATNGRTVVFGKLTEKTNKNQEGGPETP